MIAVPDTAPVLDTGRLHLRVPEAGDFEADAAFFASDRSQFIGGPMPRDRAWDTLAARIGHWVLRGYGMFSIVEKATGRYCGHAGPYWPEGWTGPEIGWTVMPEAEGRGIAREAAEATRRFAYDILGWTTAISTIEPGNTRSILLAERMGAVFETEVPHDTYGPLRIYRHPGPEALA